jgi:hypothetical protein
MPEMAQQQAAGKPGQLAVQNSNSSSCVFKPISSPGKLESLGLTPVPKVRCLCLKSSTLCISKAPGLGLHATATASLTFAAGAYARVGLSDQWCQQQAACMLVTQF